MFTNARSPKHPIGLAGLSLVGLLVLSLGLMPLMLASENVQGLMEEQGMPLPLPASEEEEVKHASIPVWPVGGNLSSLSAASPGKAPCAPEVVLSAALQEVPYPPPRG